MSRRAEQRTRARYRCCIAIESSLTVAAPAVRRQISVRAAVPLVHPMQCLMSCVIYTGIRRIEMISHVSRLAAVAALVGSLVAISTTSALAQGGNNPNTNRLDVPIAGT